MTNNEFLKPYFNLMVVEPIEKNDTLVADGDKKFNLYGKVLAIGPDVKQVQVGDCIGFSLWALTHLEINDNRYYFVPEVDGIGLVGVPKSWIK